MVSQRLACIGNLCADYPYREDLEHFKKNFFKNPSIDYQGRTKEEYFVDGKEIIKRGTGRTFNALLEDLVSKNLIEMIIPGGGAQHSYKGFRNREIGLDSDELVYFDTSIKPNFNTGIDSNDFFAEMCCYPMSLIIPIGKNGDAGTFILKSPREDINQELNNNAKRNLDEIIKEGNDILVNSVSNEILAGRIAEFNREGRLYTVVTTYLPRNGYALDKLIRESDAIFFSGREFYWFRGEEGKFNKISEHGIDKITAMKIFKDINEVAKDRGIIRPIVVTLGQYGALYHHRSNKGEEGGWVVLKKNIRENVQNYLINGKKATTSSGDNFTAKAIDGLRKGDGILDVVVNGCVFAVRNVLQYRSTQITSEDYDIIGLR